jgi:hypothetical protein
MTTPSTPESPVAVDAPPGPAEQLELFAVPSPGDASAGVPHGRRRTAPKAPAPWVETVEVAGGVL